MRSDNFIVIILLIVCVLNINVISASGFGVKIGTVDSSDEFGVVMGTTSTFSTTSIIGTGNVTTLLNLTDTPSSYSGDAGKCLIVNGGEDGVEFINCPGGGGGTDYTNLALTNQTNDFNSFNQTTTGFWDGLYNWVVNPISSRWLQFTGGNTLTFNETHFNTSVANVITDQGLTGTNISIEHGTNTTDIIPILLTGEGKQIIVMTVDTITSQNETCSFVPSPDGSVILEVCDA